MINEFYKSPFTNLNEVETYKNPISIAEFKQSARDVFKELEKLSSNTKKGGELIEELIKFSSTDLEELFSFSEQEFGFTEAAAQRMLSEVKNPSALFDNVLLRIKNETGYFDFSQGEHASLSLLFRLKGRKLTNFIFFLSPDNWILRRGSIAGANFVHFPQITIVKNDIPCDLDMIKTLATKGNLPELASVIDHEMAHKNQNSFLNRLKITGLTLFQLISMTAVIGSNNISDQFIVYSLALGAHFVKNKLFTDEFLGEIHARIVESDTPYGATNIWSRPEMLMHILKYYYKSFKGLKESISAFNMIRALRLLGVSDLEIGNIIRNDKIDYRHTLMYPGLSKALEEKISEYGIKNSKDGKTLLESIFAKHQLLLIAQRNLAKIITIQEIKREAGDYNWKYGAKWLSRFGKK